MSTLYELPFAPDWVTCGYSHGAGNKWIEVGASASVHSDPPPNPPELGLHEVADKLNALEAEIARLREALAPFAKAGTKHFLCDTDPKIAVTREDFKRAAKASEEAPHA